MIPVELINLVDQVYPTRLVLQGDDMRRTHAEREAQKMMKMIQKTGGKGLGRLFG